MKPSYDEMLVEEIHKALFSPNKQGYKPVFFHRPLNFPPFPCGDAFPKDISITMAWKPLKGKTGKFQTKDREDIGQRTFSMPPKSQMYTMPHFNYV